MTNIEIGNLVAQRRAYVNLNQQDLAEMARITTKTIYMIETGKGNPSINTLQQIAHVLGLEIKLSIKENADEGTGVQ